MRVAEAAKFALRSGRPAGPVLAWGPGQLCTTGEGAEGLATLPGGWPALVAAQKSSRGSARDIGLLRNEKYGTGTFL